MKKFLLLLLTLSVIAISCKKKKTEPEPDPEPVQEVDAAMMRIDIPGILILNTPVSVKGKIQNFKDGTITSMDINWQVGNGTVHTMSVTGLNLGKLDTYDFTHDDVYTPAQGDQTIKVWVSNVNGQTDDARPSNDLLTKSFMVASQGVQRKVLYEEFTSSTCGPCANFNTNYFNQSFLNNNAGKYALVKYQMNWPGNGDPYYTAEGGQRRQYYGVSGVPTLYIDGNEGTHFNTNDLQADLDEKYALPSPISLQAYYEITNNNDVKVKVVGTPYVSGNFTLHIAVVEKETTGNVGSNGETEFFNVMMKMVPDANGTSVACTDGTQFVERKQASLVGTNIEEMNDLEVVVFVQDDNTKAVLQSAIAVNDPSQIDF